MNATLSHRVLGFVSILAVSGCSSLIWLMLRMNAATLSYFNTLAQFLLVVLGATVVAREQWPKRHPWLTIGAFVLVGGVGMFAAIRQGQQSARENAEAQRQVAEANQKTF
jgi:ABC-type nickel/cobalt efflux system permease component RcnA